MRGPGPFLRLLAAVVVAVQAGLPVAAALADPPPAPATHHDHVSSEGEAGCQHFHDEVLCGLCLLLSAPQLAGHAAPPPSVKGPEVPVEAFTPGTLPIPSATHSSLRARAPPIS